MTTAEHDTTADELGLRRASDDSYQLVGDDGHIELTWPQLETAANLLRREFFNRAPELIRVVGYWDGTTGRHALVPAGDAPQYAAEGFDLAYGLQCPHGCEHVAWHDDAYGIEVVDTDERWSTFGYEREVTKDGVTERLAGEYDSETNYDGIGYRCSACYAAVTLPDGIQED